MDAVETPMSTPGRSTPGTTPGGTPARGGGQRRGRITSRSSDGDRDRDRVDRAERYGEEDGVGASRRGSAVGGMGAYDRESESVDMDMDEELAWEHRRRDRDDGRTADDRWVGEGMRDGWVRA